MWRMECEWGSLCRNLLDSRYNTDELENFKLQSKQQYQDLPILLRRLVHLDWNKSSCKVYTPKAANEARQLLLSKTTTKRESQQKHTESTSWTAAGRKRKTFRHSTAFYTLSNWWSAVARAWRKMLKTTMRPEVEIKVEGWKRRVEWNGTYTIREQTPQRLQGVGVMIISDPDHILTIITSGKVKFF